MIEFAYNMNEFAYSMNEFAYCILDYTLMYWVSNQTAGTLKTIAVPPNTTEYTVDGLTASTHYTFEIYASTAMGRGPSQRATMESGVPPELPGAPSSLAVSNVQARSVSLQFVPGFDGKTIIRKWIVEAQVGTSTTWTLVFNVR